MMQKGATKLQYVSTDEQVADALTNQAKPSLAQTLSSQAWCCLERPSSKGGVVMLQWDCIILGHLFRIDPVTSVLENLVGLHHP